jgi:hypothetical protein
MRYVKDNSHRPILTMGSFRWVRILGESECAFSPKESETIQHSFEEEEIKESGNLEL